MSVAVVEVISLITSLLQVINRASAEVVTMTALIEKAKAEGRDLTDDELLEARDAATKAIARLA